MRNSDKIKKILEDSGLVCLDDLEKVPNQGTLCSFICPCGEKFERKPRSMMKNKCFWCQKCTLELMRKKI